MIDTLWFRILIIALSGAAGALARWGMTVSINHLLGERTTWPISTLAVNTLGCFVFGFCFGYFRETLPISHALRFLIFTGFLGAFTTYSTFAYDTIRLQHEHTFWLALANVIVQVVAGWLAIAAGMWLGERI